MSIFSTVVQRGPSIYMIFKIDMSTTMVYQILDYFNMSFPGTVGTEVSLHKYFECSCQPHGLPNIWLPQNVIAVVKYLVGHGADYSNMLGYNNINYSNMSLHSTVMERGPSIIILVNESVGYSSSISVTWARSPLSQALWIGSILCLWNMNNQYFSIIWHSCEICIIVSNEVMK